MTTRWTWRQMAALRALAVRHGLLECSTLVGRARDMHDMLTLAELEEISLMPPARLQQALLRLSARRRGHRPVSADADRVPGTPDPPAALPGHQPEQGVNAVNWDIIEGKWEQLKGGVKEKWGNLTDDDLAQLNGKRDQLSGKLQERYGWAKDQADKEIDTYFKDR